MKRPMIIRQTSMQTTIKCPECRGQIKLHHDDVGEPNDAIGRLDLGEQNYSYVVCVDRGAGKYCDFAADMTFAK